MSHAKQNPSRIGLDINKNNFETHKLSIWGIVSIKEVFLVISPPNLDGFFSNMAHFEAPITMLRSTDHDFKVGHDLKVD